MTESLLQDVHQALGRCSCGACHSIEEAIAMNTPKVEGSLLQDAPRTDKRLRRMWLERSVAQGWTPWQSRFLLRAATKSEKPYGPFLWAPTGYPL